MRTYGHGPTRTGRFGDFGGRYAAESQIGFLQDLTDVFHQAICDVHFWSDFWELVPSRPTPLQYAAGLTRLGGGAAIWLKWEDLRAFGSQNAYNLVGQALLARRMGRTEIITECGSAKHGIACAKICSRLELECTVFVGRRDARRQQEAMDEMARLGASVRMVDSGGRTLRAAVSAALHAASERFATAYYLPSGPIGPHPYPLICYTFQSFVGDELLSQLGAAWGSLPDMIVAPTGGNAAGLGLFAPFVANPSVVLVGVESAGAPVISQGSRGVFHGMCTKVLQDPHGQIQPSHSTCPDLNYPGVEDTVARGVDMLREQEGIAAGLDTGLAVEEILQRAHKLGRHQNVILLVTGRDPIDHGLMKEGEEAGDGRWA
ncbi:hypothetical protein NYO67_4566 [Aspergillus flavus]|nr:hypothetical protein NYO67_4566 [Aspergillus flavus]